LTALGGSAVVVVDAGSNPARQPGVIAATEPQSMDTGSAPARRADVIVSG